MLSAEGGGSGGLRSRQARGLGTVPSCGGLQRPAYPCLRTWRITGEAYHPNLLPCPVVSSGAGQCPAHSFGDPITHLEVEVSGGRREKSCCLQGHGEGWGSPCPAGTRVLQAAGRSRRRVACSALGTNLLCPQQAPGGKVTVLGPRVTRSLDLRDLGSLQAPAGLPHAKGVGCSGSQALTHHVCFLNAAAKVTQQESRWS